MKTFILILFCLFCLLFTTFPYMILGSFVGRIKSGDIIPVNGTLYYCKEVGE